MSAVLDQIVRGQHRRQAIGIPSLCSAHPFVLDTAFSYATAHHLPLLIEATSNQVNQFGGYTGQTPADFSSALRQQAQSFNFSLSALILGGDHLGPQAWKHESAQKALEKAQEMLQAYARANFTKFHLDASMPCADDRSLSVETIAWRTALLASAVEQACPEENRRFIRYVIGSEVPIPGGTQTEEGTLSVTSPEKLAETVELTRHAFLERGLADAWERVAAVVVQPGVEFGDRLVFDYVPTTSQMLVRAIESYPNLVFEAHSTDYQTPISLKNMVADHFAILKVGPGLTDAFRQAIFALGAIESELLGSRAIELSNIRATLENVMLAAPAYWENHYHGSVEEQRFARSFSFSDRIRYYWPDSRVQSALMRLLENLSHSPLPLPLINQYFPLQAPQIRQGALVNHPAALIRSKIQEVLDAYYTACGWLDASHRKGQENNA